MVAMAAGLSVFAIAMMQTPKFTSATMLLVGAPIGEDDSSGSTHSAFYNAQIEFIRSPIILTQVAKQLDLANDSDWKAPRGESVFSELPFPLSAGRSIEQRLLAAVSARRKGDSSVIEITAVAERADQAHDIAAAIGAAYTQAWMSKVYDVTTIDAAAAASGAAPPLPAPDALPIAPEIAAQLKASIAPQAAAPNAKEVRLRRVQALVDKHASVGDLADELHSDALRSLATQLQDVETREATAKLRDGDQAASVQAIRTERAWLSSKIDEEVQQALASLKKEAAAASPAPTVQIAAQQKAATPATTTPPAPPSVALTDQNQLAKSNRGDAAVQPRLPTEAAFPSTPSRIPANVTTIVSATFPVEASSPRILSALGLSSAIGIFVGLLVSIFVELTDDRLRRSEDVARRLQRMPMAVVPLLRASDFRQLAPRDRHPAGYLVDKPMSEFAEGLRMIRASILYSVSSRPLKVIAITSCRNMEGKTAMSLGLARVAAMSGQKVLLIDCDTSHAGVCDLLGLEPKSFAAESWRDALAHDPETSLEILTWPKAAPKSKGDAAPTISVRDIELMRPLYDLIVLDAPALLATQNASAVCHNADQTVFVARSQRTRSSAVKKALKILGSESEQTFGVVLNFAENSLPSSPHSRDGYYVA